MLPNVKIFVFSQRQVHQNKKCIEVATVEFLKGRLVLLLEMERPLSISHVFSKQSVFYFIKLSALFFSPLMLYIIFNTSLLFLPVFAGEISLYHVFLFLTVFWPLHGKQCCTFYTIHISMGRLHKHSKKKNFELAIPGSFLISACLLPYEVAHEAIFFQASIFNNFE